MATLLRLAVENDDCALLENLLHEEEVDVNYTFRLKTNRFGVCVQDLVTGTKSGVSWLNGSLAYLRVLGSNLAMPQKLAAIMIHDGLHDRSTGRSNTLCYKINHTYTMK